MPVTFPCPKCKTLLAIPDEGGQVRCTCGYVSKNLIAADFAEPENRPSFTCPYCKAKAPPRLESRISTAGWVMFILLLVLFCWPLCWLGLMMKEETRVCSSCGIRLG